MNAAALSPQLDLEPTFTQGMVLQFLQLAYNLRSKIVHGEDIRENNRRFQGRVYSVYEFAYLAAEIARRGIDWVMEHHEPGDKLIIDWETLYFSGPKN